MRRTIAIIVVSIGVAAGTMLLLGIRLMETDQDSPEASREALKSLPYLDWQPMEKADIGKQGVTIYDPDKSYKGLNICNYDSYPKGYVIDMSGEVLHVWSRPRGRWHHVEVMETGDLLVIDKNKLLIKLDWESNTQWTSQKKYHHDVDVADNGDIYALSWDVLEIPHSSGAIPIVNDFITILASDGTIKKDVSVFDLFGGEITEAEKDEIREHMKRKELEGEDIEVKPQTIFDVFHTNTLEIVKRITGGLAGKGSVLICIRNLDIIAIIDISREEVVWRLDVDDLEWPHQPSIVEGNILVFDNGPRRGYSRVVEIDPRTGKTVWEYAANPRESFFSRIRGGCQRLPNGNTLITESDKARAFEVTPDGKVVWEFYGTEIMKVLKRRRPIYRMTRLPSDSHLSGLLEKEQVIAP
jgi:outer membrane protein assembly factor BamB